MAKQQDASRYLPERLIGPVLPKAMLAREQPTGEEIGAATLRYGHDTLLWWCEEHRHLAPGSVPCPRCAEFAEAERRRVERLIREARRRQGHCSDRSIPTTRAAKRRTQHRGRR